MPRRQVARQPAYAVLTLSVAALCWTLAAPGAAQKKGKPAAEKDYKDQLPRIPPHAPADALKTFKTLPGFRVEQVAAEPLVTDPVAMSFDENGRLYVVEMLDYSEQDRAMIGRVRLLEDTDGDGRFDRSTVFLDKLSWPTAVTCYDGGVFIGAAPDILYAKDTDGDGKADVVRKVFTGFGRSNVQGLLNSFQWGLDNRIHGATSSNGGQVRKAGDAAAKAVNIGGRNFSFDPRTLDFTPTSGASQHGMTYDDWGRRFVCHNSDPIQLVMYEDRYVARNPYLAAPNPKVSISVEGAQSAVFRVSPVEPWRVLRTKLRVGGLVPGPIEGGGTPAGYFTGTTGVTIYRGDAWPAEFRGQALVGEVASNLVHRKVLEPAGVGFRARRVDVKKEFLASTDIWFRPVQFANAPDGTLYVADFYREVVEHPASLPPEIKKHLNLNSRGRGRLYRIVPAGFKQRPQPRLGKATAAELVALLEHRNGWHRDTAARLLWQRQDRTAVIPLQKLALGSRLPEGRMHALYALHGLKALTEGVVLSGLVDPHPRVREHAVILAESLAPTSAPVRARLYEMVKDEDARVRYQLTFSLGEQPSAPPRNAALAKLARRDGADRWVRVAILSSLAEGADAVLRELAGDAKFRASAGGRELLTQLARQIGQRAWQSEVAAALQSLEGLPAGEKALAAALVRSLREGLARSGSSLRKQMLAGGSRAKELLGELLAAARRKAADEKQPLKERVEAVRTLGLGAFAEVRPLLTEMLASQQPQPVQLAAVETLSRFPDAAAGRALVAAWPAFSPRVRSAAAESIFSRPEWAAAFLDAVQRKKVAATDVDPARLKLLQGSADPALRAHAARVAKLLNLGRRTDVVAAYRPALELKGDAPRGKMVFQKVCASCHRLEGVGHETGPSLATLQNRGAEAILLNVLDPNREVNPQYVNYVVETKDGRTFTGMVAAETATSVTLRRGDNQSDTILRIDIERMRSTGLSLMPEGLEQQIDRQGMADLLAYLTSLK
jgi:putative membrane-bound dehydrogenase-like protein